MADAIVPVFVFGLIVLWLAYYFRQGMRGDAAKSMPQAIADKTLYESKSVADQIGEKLPKPVKTALFAVGIAGYVVYLIIGLAVVIALVWFLLKNGQPDW